MILGVELPTYDLSGQANGRIDAGPGKLLQRRALGRLDFTYGTFFFRDGRRLSTLYNLLPLYVRVAAGLVESLARPGGNVSGILHASQQRRACRVPARDRRGYRPARPIAGLDRF